MSGIVATIKACEAMQEFLALSKEDKGRKKIKF